MINMKIVFQYIDNNLQMKKNQMNILNHMLIFLRKEIMERQ